MEFYMQADPDTGVLEGGGEDEIAEFTITGSVTPTAVSMTKTYSDEGYAVVYKGTSADTMTYTGTWEKHVAGRAQEGGFVLRRVRLRTWASNGERWTGTWVGNSSGRPTSASFDLDVTRSGLDAIKGTGVDAIGFFSVEGTVSIGAIAFTKTYNATRGWYRLEYSGTCESLNAARVTVYKGDWRKVQQPAGGGGGTQRPLEGELAGTFVLKRERLRKAHPTSLRVRVLSFSDLDFKVHQFVAKIEVTASWLASRRDLLSLACDRGDPVEWRPPTVRFPSAIEATTATSAVTIAPREGAAPNDKRLVASVTTTIAGTFDAHLDLRSFPFDEHALEIPISFERDNAGGEGEEDRTFEIVLGPPPSCEFGANFSSGLAEFNMLDTARPVLKDAGKRSLCVVIRVKRRAFSFLVRVVVVLSIISLVTLAVFALDVENEQGNRLGNAFTMFLTVIAYQFVLANTLPELPYLTVLDVHMLTSMAFVIAIILEVALLCVYSRNENTDRERLEEMNSFVLWWNLGTWGVIQLIYALCCASYHSCCKGSVFFGRRGRALPAVGLLAPLIGLLLW